jgi:hypothetical protein
MGGESRDVVQVGINDSAYQDSAIWLESLPDDFTSSSSRRVNVAGSGQGKCRQARRAHRLSVLAFTAEDHHGQGECPDQPGRQ